METDVKGQLGGLEANDQVRRRLADESRTWTCPGGCNGGKSNQEIMKGCEEAVRELGGETSNLKREEEKVPEELKLGWRDEMEKKKEAGGTGDSEEEESARLAEGFVRTGNPEGSGSGGGGEGGGAGVGVGGGRGTTIIGRPPVEVTEGGSSSRAAQAEPAVLSHPALQQTQQQQQQQQQRLQLAQRRRISNDHDVWLDRAIIAVAVLLAAAVAKVMLG